MPPPLKRSRSPSVSSSEDATTPFSSLSPPDGKLIHLDQDTAPEPPPLITCSLPPHEPLSFVSLDDYHVHYHQTHTNRCSECQRNFPDTHFLHLHIAENHDPIRAARRDRGEQTYACLVPSCDRLCSTAPKRRMHCIDKHHFPKNYDFFVINNGIDSRRSMLRSPRRRRSSAISSATSASASASASARQRGQSMSSTLGDKMDLVQDDEKTKTELAAKVDGDQGEAVTRRSPIKLRGRGGFTHPQSVDPGHMTTTASPPADVMDSLTSRMSSLQFVPHSVRMARGRGRGRGRGQ